MCVCVCVCVCVRVCVYVCVLSRNADEGGQTPVHCTMSFGPVGNILQISGAVASACK